MVTVSFKMADVWADKCEPWLAGDGSIYQRTDTAPPPSKDFVQVFITSTEVIFRMWRILPPTRADANQVPQENRSSYEEFFDDTKMRGDIYRTLGEREVDYIDRLLNGHIDYPNRLPRRALMNILYHMDLVTISKLSQVNKLFHELCASDQLWSKLYMRHTTQPITHELLMLTDKKGWKEVFFMNKVQLQMHLRREMDRPKSREQRAISRAGRDQETETQPPLEQAVEVVAKDLEKTDLSESQSEDKTPDGPQFFLTSE